MKQSHQLLKRETELVEEEVPDLMSVELREDPVE